MDTWKTLLAESGKRITKPRLAVIDALRRCEQPQSPEQVLEHARVNHPELGLATVYRTLALFVEIGVARPILQNNAIRYVAASLGHRHALVCEKCGKTVEFPGHDNIADVIELVQKETGFVIKEHLLQLGGLCPACQQNQRSDESND